MTTLVLIAAAESSLPLVQSRAAALVQLFSLLYFAALKGEQTHSCVLFYVYLCLGGERIKCALKIFLSAKLNLSLFLVLFRSDVPAVPATGWLRCPAATGAPSAAPAVRYSVFR